MKSIHIYFGSDSDFDKAISGLNYNSIGDLLNQISKKEITLTGTGAQITNEPPFEIENLIMYTDDYGAINEWALLGFSNNILEHNISDMLKCALLLINFCQRRKRDKNDRMFYNR